MITRQNTRNVSHPFIAIPMWLLYTIYIYACTICGQKSLLITLEKRGVRVDNFVFKNQQKLRYGITTGTCAVIAATAAAKRLLLDIDSGTISYMTPKKISIERTVVCEEYESGSYAVYKTQKDSGDDPDVTDGVFVYAKVEMLSKKQLTEVQNSFCFEDMSYPNLFLDGGEGIGRITMDGMEQRVGQAAINSGPRAMIFEAVAEICALAKYDKPVKITIMIPDGVYLASKTFNPKLGIKGGISVLGTSGIVEPMSEKAIIDTIDLEIRMRYNRGERSLLVTPGNYGQGYAKHLLGLDVSNSLKCSNFIGETLDLAVSYGYEKLLLIGNLGKLVKLAAGIMNTHSRVADGRMEILAVHAMLAGGGTTVGEQIMACVNTEQVLDILEQNQLLDAVMKRICAQIEIYIRRRVGGQLRFGVILFSESKGLLGETAGSFDLLAEWKEE